MTDFISFALRKVLTVVKSRFSVDHRRATSNILVCLQEERSTVEIGIAVLKDQPAGCLILPTNVASPAWFRN